MPQTAAQKAEKKKAALALAAKAAGMANQQVKKKKKKSTFSKILSGALSAAETLLPLAAPLLMASHRPTAMRVGKVPVAAAGVGMSLGSITGLKQDIPLTVSNTGTITSKGIMSFDYIGAINNPSGYSAGDVIVDILLSPQEPALNATQLYLQSETWDEYFLDYAEAIYQPSCSVEQDGQLTVMIRSDPAEGMPGSPLANIQSATAQEGSETDQTWLIVKGVLTSKNKNGWLYTDANSGSDIRETVAGRIIVVATTDITAGTTLGSLYLLTKMKFKTRSAANANVKGFVHMEGLTFNSAVGKNPMLTASFYSNIGGVVTQYSDDTEGFVPAALPVGRYMYTAVTDFSTPPTNYALNLFEVSEQYGEDLSYFGSYPGNGSTSNISKSAIVGVIDIYLQAGPTDLLFAFANGSVTGTVNAASLTLIAVDDNFPFGDLPALPPGVSPVDLVAMAPYHSFQRARIFSRTLQSYEKKVDILSAQVAALQAGTFKYAPMAVLMDPLTNYKTVAYKPKRTKQRQLLARPTMGACLSPVSSSSSQSQTVLSNTHDWTFDNIQYAWPRYLEEKTLPPTVSSYISFCNLYKITLKIADYQRLEPHVTG